jgi:hypothetical protein
MLPDKEGILDSDWAVRMPSHYNRPQFQLPRLRAVSQSNGHGLTPIVGQATLPSHRTRAGTGQLLRSGECCSGCYIGIVREPARIKRPHSIIIGRSRRPPSICVCGDIGWENTRDGCKVYAVGRPFKPKTSLVICIVSPRESNLAG